MEKDLVTARLYRRKKRESGYFGSVSEKVYTGDIRIVTAPLGDKLSAEIYGERTANMLSVTAYPGAGVIAGDTLRVGERDYKIIAVSRYTDHVEMTAEGE